MDNSDEGSKHNWLLYFLVGMLVWAIFFKENKYEDRTAEEWFNEYDWLTGCIEESSNPKEDCL